MDETVFLRPLVSIENADRAPYTELELDALWDKLDTTFYGNPDDAPLIGAGRFKDRSEYLMRGVQAKVLTLEQAEWMYKVALGFALNSDVYDSIER